MSRHGVPCPIKWLIVVGQKNLKNRKWIVASLATDKNKKPFGLVCCSFSFLFELKKICPGSGWSTVSEHTLCNREVVGSNSAGSWDVFPLTILLVQCALKQVPREAAALLDAQLRRLRQNELNDGWKAYASSFCFWTVFWVCLRLITMNSEV